LLLGFVLLMARGAAETKKKKKDEGGMSVGKTLEKISQKKEEEEKPVRSAMRR
jgi:hypothetical protein